MTKGFGFCLDDFGVHRAGEGTGEADEGASLAGYDADLGKMKQGLVFQKMIDFLLALVVV